MPSRQEEMAAAIDAFESQDETEVDDRSHVSVPPAIEPSQVYSVRIPVEQIEQLRMLAQDKGVRPTTLLRGWVLERLDQEICGKDRATNVILSKLSPPRADDVARALHDAALANTRAA